MPATSLFMVVWAPACAGATVLRVLVSLSVVAAEKPTTLKTVVPAQAHCCPE